MILRAFHLYFRHQCRAWRSKAIIGHGISNIHCCEKYDYSFLWSAN